MEAIKQILSFFVNIFVNYLEIIRAILKIFISSTSTLDFLTIFISILIPVSFLAMSLVRKPLSEIFTNLTLYLYVFLMSIPTTFVAGDNIALKINGELTKNANGTFLFWFLAIYGMLTLLNRVFIIETAGKRVVKHNNRNNKSRNKKFYKANK